MSRLAPERVFIKGIVLKDYGTSFPAQAFYKQRMRKASGYTVVPSARPSP